MSDPNHTAASSAENEIARFLPEGTFLEGKYRVGRMLGAGGMGAVFEAQHTLLKKSVAIKVMLPEYSKNKEMAARTVQEARAASATGHRNIVSVTDLGWTPEGALFVVMEFLQGRTLREIIETEGVLKPARAIRLIIQVLNGLAAVHNKGIIHRDLKPENIMVIDEDGEEVAKILDFGISKATGDEDRLDLTRSGFVMGTPQYMAPEQAMGSTHVDQRTDLYGVGSILYTMLTGNPPIDAPNYNAMIVAILQGTIPAPSTKTKHVTPQLDRVVMKALAKSPDDRYRTAVDFKTALTPFTVEGAANAVTSGTSPQGAGQTVVEHVEQLDTLSESDLVDPGARLNSNAPHSPPSVPKAQGSNAPAEMKQPRSFAMEHVTPRSDVKPTAPPKKLAAAAFAPPPDDGPLELAVTPARSDRHTFPESSSSTKHRKQTMYDAPSAPIPWSGIVTVALVIGVAGIVWLYRDQMSQLVSEQTVIQAPVSNVVLILVNTTPKDAEIYVDGVLQVTKPFELPRSDRAFDIRVAKEGYVTKRLTVQPTRDQSLDVELRKQADRSH